MSRAFFHYQMATLHDEGQYRHLERTISQRRAVRSLQADRPSPLAILRAGLVRLARREDHSLTDYPCRLPDGSMGRTAIRLVDGEWAAVCAMA
jgi:hypothetical protein